MKKRHTISITERLMGTGTLIGSPWLLLKAANRRLSYVIAGGRKNPCARPLHFSRHAAAVTCRDSSNSPSQGTFVLDGWCGEGKRTLKHFLITTSHRGPASSNATKWPISRFIHISMYARYLIYRRHADLKIFADTRLSSYICCSSFSRRLNI